MTDLNKEREAFEEAYLSVGGKQRELELEYGEYTNSKSQLGWDLWQKAKAQAVPEGYVLMPKVPTEKMFQAYKRYSVAPMSTLSKTGYKAMVEAAGDQNENS